MLDAHRKRYFLIDDEKSKDPEMMILQKVIQEYLNAFIDHNVDEIMDKYLDNAIIIPIDNEIINDKKTLEKYLKSPEHMNLEIKSMEVVDIEKSSDIAYQINKYFILINSKGIKNKKVLIHNVLIWHRQLDGTWKLKVNIMNKKD
jgi:ketosteroid isomerase-like protein